MSDEFVSLDEVRQVASPELLTRLKALSRDSHRHHARLLVHLGEVEARGVYRDYACASMFAYCFEELRMSEAEAYLRIQAARLSRKFPLILEMIGRGTLHLIGIKLLGPHLTEDNHAELLARASGKRKREIQRLVAGIAPKSDVPSRMRKLPEPRTVRNSGADVQSTLPGSEQAMFALESVVRSVVDAAKTRIAAEVCPSDPARSASLASSTITRSRESLESSGARFVAKPNARIAPSFAASAATHAPSFSETRELTVAPSRAPSDSVANAGRESSDARFALEVPRKRSSSTPLSPGRYKVEFTAGQGLHDKLEQLQALLRHQVPDGDLAAIVERAADLLIEHTMKKRFGQTRSPKAGSGKRTKANSRYIPRSVVREVHARDEGQCTFVSAEGKRCSERAFLELHHHDRPYARGGNATTENLRLVCRAHNALFAEQDYGRAFMRSKRRHTGDRATSSAQTESEVDALLPKRWHLRADRPSKRCACHDARARDGTR